VRFVLTALIWLVTTIALAVALPAAWAQQNVVDSDGYAAFSQRAASDPALQQAVAGELTTQLVTLAANSGYGVQTDLFGTAAAAYTRSSAFPGQFATANRFAHRWMFTDSVSSDLDPQGRWVIDLGPMLADSSLQSTLQAFGIKAPSSLPVPLTENAPAALRPGRLQPAATWGPWVSVGATVLAGVLALLTIAVARRRGKAVAALGVSALLVGAAGWAGLEIGRRYVGNALGDTSGDVRQIADSLVGHAISSMHHWLNVTLAVGAGLVVLGVVFALLGGIGGRADRGPAPTSDVRS
jgi:hypothetical protein